MIDMLTENEQDEDEEDADDGKQMFDCFVTQQSVLFCNTNK